MRILKYVNILFYKIHEYIKQFWYIFCLITFHSHRIRTNTMPDYRFFYSASIYTILSEFLYKRNIYIYSLINSCQNSLIFIKDSFLYFSFSAFYLSKEKSFDFKKYFKFRFLFGLYFLENTEHDLSLFRNCLSFCDKTFVVPYIKN